MQVVTKRYQGSSNLADLACLVIELDRNGGCEKDMHATTGVYIRHPNLFKIQVCISQSEVKIISQTS